MFLLWIGCAAPRCSACCATTSTASRWGRPGAAPQGEPRQAAAVRERRTGDAPGEDGQGHRPAPRPKASCIPPTGAKASCATCLLAAQACELDVDLHVDEELNAAAVGLSATARLLREIGYEGRVVCGHICALAAQPGSAGPGHARRGGARADHGRVAARHQPAAAGRRHRPHAAPARHHAGERGARARHPAAVRERQRARPFRPARQLRPGRGAGHGRFGGTARRALRQLVEAPGRSDWLGKATADRSTLVGAPADLVLFTDADRHGWAVAHPPKRVVLRDGRATQATPRPSFPDNGSDQTRHDKDSHAPRLHPAPPLPALPELDRDRRAARPREHRHRAALRRHRAARPAPALLGRQRDRLGRDGQGPRDACRRGARLRAADHHLRQVGRAPALPRHHDADRHHAALDRDRDRRVGLPLGLSQAAVRQRPWRPAAGAGDGGARAAPAPWRSSWSCRMACRGCRAPRASR